MHFQELVAAYAAEAAATGKNQLMLTAAVSAGKGTIDAGYEIAEIAKYSTNLTFATPFQFYLLAIRIIIGWCTKLMLCASLGHWTSSTS